MLDSAAAKSLSYFLFAECCLYHADFTFIHSKFLAPLPSTLDEFRCSLGCVFPHILDVKHVMKKLGSQKNLNNIYVATSYLNSRFFAPIDVEIPHQGKC